MEDTYIIKAIILNREPFKENDSRITVYSLEKGRLELVARGTKKILSKLAGHLEPVSVSNLMVVKGRQYDYAGAAVNEINYPNIKSNLDKITAVGIALKAFNKIIKPGITDSRLFDLLIDYFTAVEKGKDRNFNLLSYFFIFKLLVALGYKPELYKCVSCQKKIIPRNNRFSLSGGGLVCADCQKKHRSRGLTISDNAIKMLRMIETGNFGRLVKVKINKELNNELIKIIESFFNYNFM